MARFATPRTVLAMMMREMQTTYGRNVGGYLWAFLEPVAAIAFFTAIVDYGLQIRSPAIGTSFALFFATGFLPLTIFLEVSKKVGTALNFSGPLMKYPSVTLADALFARLILTAITQILVALIVFALIHAIFDVSTILNVPAIVAALGMAVLLGFGIGVMNCFLIAVFPIWESIWAVLTRPLFIVSGVFFTYDEMPKAAQEVLWWNPVIHCVGMMRRGFYATYDAPYVSWLFPVLLGLGLLLLGLILLERYHQDILNR